MFNEWMGYLFLGVVLKEAVLCCVGYLRRVVDHPDTCVEACAEVVVLVV